ncbi:hypothetical protein [Terracidiphilus sp.]|jgi:hypothetical protein|uniref:hypothetical protein n=1 Tax=Terracidiphilus sp. TaxID=1964191 RepID=UPI003C14B14E
MTRIKPWSAAILVGVLTIAVSSAHCAAQEKDSFTPMPLDAGFGRMDITPPTTPADDIIKKFAAKESEFQQALNHYTYQRLARVQEVDDDNKVSGEYYQVDDVTFADDGRRTERTTFAPESSLKQVIMTPSDMQDIQKGYPFVLTTEEIAQYDIKYVGRQKVDDIDCYVFDVNPKQIVKGHRYLSGRIWVDSDELQIVVTNGRMVPDDTRRGSEDLHPPFMTWRQQVDGHYWFPVYTRAEGILHFAGGRGAMAMDVHIRDIIKYTDYKRFGSTIRIIAGEEAPDPNQNQQQQQPKKPQ